MDADFGYVDELVPGVRWDARYATSENFTGAPVDGYLVNRIVGTRAMGASLEQASEKAAALGLGLFLWDGYRPQRAIDAFRRWSEQPEDGRTKQHHYPNITRAQMFEQGYVAARSGHNRGSAVDLTLCRLATGDLLDMGGDHDLMDKSSWHGAQGVSPLATRNRELLCSIMEDCGLDRYDREWWHYSLRVEPYPDACFDFPIT
jgi:D-alanyl-D-alanine dipeptidase